MQIRDQFGTSEFQVQFSLGGEKADAKMENDVENRVNDGEWHTVTLEYSNKVCVPKIQMRTSSFQQLTLSLDDCETHPSLLLNNSPNCAVRAKLKLEKKYVLSPPPISNNS